MRRLNVFNLVTLDGYFLGQGGDISWHRVDHEFQEVAENNVPSGNTLLLGRVSYELLASYWSSCQSLNDGPVIAQGMNISPKIVFSRTLKRADWVNTRVIAHDMLEQVQKLKQQSGKDLTILGSGTIVAQLTD